MFRRAGVSPLEEATLPLAATQERHVQLPLFSSHLGGMSGRLQACELITELLLTHHRHLVNPRASLDAPRTLVT